MAMARTRTGSKRIGGSAGAKSQAPSKRSTANRKRGMAALPGEEPGLSHDQSNVTLDGKHAHTARPVAAIRGTRVSARISSVKASSGTTAPTTTTETKAPAAPNGNKAVAAKRTKAVKVKAPSRVASGDPAKVPEASFIMSSSPRKPRQSLPGGTHGLAGIPSAAKRRSSDVLAGEKVEVAVKRQRSNQSDSSEASENEGGGGDRDVPPSPLKAILSPVMGLLRRVSGIAQDPLGSISGSNSRAPTPPPANGLAGEKDEEMDEKEDEDVQPAVVGAPAGSPEAESLTAPPMNPTTTLNNGTTGSSSQQQQQI
ncbi:hypothetical protein EC988_008089, partial [Linderina pennispora]